MTARKEECSDWVSDADGQSAREELDGWQKFDYRLPDGRSHFFSIYDEARLASKLARAVCGEPDPGLIQYLMERLRKERAETELPGSLVATHEEIRTVLHALYEVLSSTGALLDEKLGRE